MRKRKLWKKCFPVVATIVSVFMLFTACGLLPNKLSGTYKLEISGVVGALASAAGAFDSLTFSGNEVSVNVAKGVSWTGTYTLDGSLLSISPSDKSGTKLNGSVSSDKKTINIAGLKFIK